LSHPMLFQIEHEGRMLRGIPLSVDRIAQVLALEESCFPDPWSEQLFRQEARPEPHRWNLLLMDGEDLAAYAISWVVSGETHLLNFAVRPDLQGRGLGRRFLRWLMEAARKAGDTVFLLEVRASNDRARGLYESEGLKTVTHRDGYYPDTGEKALVMMAFLQNPEEKP